MANTATPPQLVDAASVSPVRLHGEACWHCGAVSDLHYSGEVGTATDGGIRVWTIRSCRGCQP